MEKEGKIRALERRDEERRWKKESFDRREFHLFFGARENDRESKTRASGRNRARVQPNVATRVH